MKKILAFLLAAVMLFSLTAVASADNLKSSSVNRYNVMLVVDGSESLIKGETSDPDGMRYDALKLFLGLLTESGNNVGAIVFDSKIMLDTGVQPMNSMSDKLALAKQIEQKGTGDYTNIGGALLTAVEDLEAIQQENDLPCIILLFSDGNTSMDSSYGLQQSKENGEEAIERAVADGIEIHSIWLNASGNGDSDEITKYTTATNGSYEEVTSADDLSAAFRRFYTLINNTEYNPANKETFDAEGKVDIDFDVANFGIEEVNIVVDITNPLENIEITKPDGSVYDNSDIKNMSITTSRYQLIKLPSPASGHWTVHLEGEPENTVDVSMLYNFNLNSELTVNNDSDDFLHEVPYTFSLNVEDDTVGHLTLEDLQTMGATLNIVNARTQATESVPMTATSDACYTADYSFEMGSYYVYATIGCGNFVTKSNQLTVNAGNQSPVAADDISETIDTGLFQKGTYTVDLNTLFTDPEGQPMTYTTENSYGDAVQLIDNNLTVNCFGIDHCYLTITGTDNIGASDEISIDLTENNISPAVAITETVKTGLFQSGVYSVDLNSLFTIPAGQALTYTMENNYGDAVQLDGSNFSVNCKDIDHCSLTITAADQNGATDEIPVELTEKNVTVRTIITIAIIILLIALAIFLFVNWKNNLKCNLEITIDAFDDNENWSSLVPIYNFRGKKQLKKLGNIYGANAKDYWFEATKNPDMCLFKGKTAFYSEGRKVKEVKIYGGSTIKIGFNPDSTVGLEIES